MKLENIKYSLENLWQRKTRSFLTVLSILVGITTIFIFVSFGWGLLDYVNELAAEAGTDKLIVQAKGVGAPGTNNAFVLDDSDLDAIARVKQVSEAAGIAFKVVEAESDDERKYVYGIGYPKDTSVWPLVTEMFTVEVESGRDLRKSDNSKIVLGYNYQFDNDIFSKGLRVGDKITVQSTRFEVVGFYEKVGNPQDDSNVYFTFEALDNLYPEEELTYAMLLGRVPNPDDMERAVSNVERSLRRERGLEEGKEDFFVQTFDELIEQFQTSLNIVVGFIILIALISVVVSAINTSNTMFTSILERTKEIGILKAIGATNDTVRNIFLFESSFLGAIGGIIGLGLGYVLTEIGGAVLDSLGWGFLAPHYSPAIFLILLGFATLVGTISGVVPAINAARQHPVESLRYE